MINYHQDKKDILDKLKECEFIGVGKRDPHNYTKVFFGLDKNKNKKFDFVVGKCIEKIQNLDRKNKKNKEEKEEE
jgi:spore coat polysaccharide biosynthesis predicted glycosyltransferase SpsG